VVVAAVDCFARYGWPASDARTLSVVLHRSVSRRLCSSYMARRVILGVCVLTVVYNATHWFEVEAQPCWVEQWNTTSLMVSGVCRLHMHMSPLHTSVDADVISYE
jgi:hypothetical protein